MGDRHGSCSLFGLSGLLLFAYEKIDSLLKSETFARMCEGLDTGIGPALFSGRRVLGDFAMTLFQQRGLVC